MIIYLFSENSIDLFYDISNDKIYALFNNKMTCHELYFFHDTNTNSSYLRSKYQDEYKQIYPKLPKIHNKIRDEINLINIEKYKFLYILNNI